jgi:hypothetical protein
MSKQSDFEEYRHSVRSIWIVQHFAMTFSNELIKLLMDNGFLIDNITVSYSDCDNIQWVGTCYDEDLVDYKFVATWTANMEKFVASDVHYYDITDLEIEPK